MRIVPVGGEALQPADTDGFALDAAHALAFALAFLGAYPAAHSGQGGGLGDHLISTLKIPCCHFLDEFGNMDAHGAARHAGMVFAVQAALGFVYGRFGGVAQGYFLEILIANLRGLGRHGVLLHRHVGHVTSPP